ncbi:hypothetical protein FQN57_003714 [Myotisia sp. PD_48]|nr:hypothetical protein FQN57_003714 [Myotisia sp. PD_48]
MENLLQRIKLTLTHKTFQTNVSANAPPQSSLGSDLSTNTLDNWRCKKEKIDRFNSEQEARRDKDLIMSGRSSTLTDRELQPLDPEDSCVMCKATPARRCKRCLSCRYCSTKCQASDFQQHKLLCKQYATQPVRPSTAHKRAIFFPTSTRKPVMIWILCKREIDEDRHRYSMLMQKVTLEKAP